MFSWNEYRTLISNITTTKHHQPRTYSTLHYGQTIASVNLGEHLVFEYVFIIRITLQLLLDSGYIGIEMFVFFLFVLYF